MGQTEQLQKLQIAELFLLIVGILLSGSRTVFFLAVIGTVFVAVKQKKYRKAVFSVIIVILLLAVLYTHLTGNMQTIGRFMTSSLSSSTLIGRIIYWKDGIRELIQHPFGLGYLGYWYRESTIQTASYSVRFIHNDFLQMALDTGIFPAVLFVVMCIKSLLSKGLRFENKVCMIIMCAHFCMDFDLEFTAVWYLFLLIISDSSNEKYIVCAYKKLVIGLEIGISCFGLYLGLAMIPRYMGYQSVSSSLLPFYTESNRELLAVQTDPEKALLLSERISKQNGYINECYDIQAILAYGEQDYEAMAVAKEKSLSLQKYNMAAYDNYLKLLSQALTDAVERKDKDGAMFLLERARNVKQLLKAVKDNTTQLAWKTRDIPQFTLSELSEEFLTQVEEILQ